MALNNEKKELNDHQLNRLLKLASQPLPMADFESRLMQRIETEAPSNNIIGFPQRRKSSFWLAGLPLAASLLVGIWFGANDTLSDFLPLGNGDLSLNVAGLLSSTNSGDDIDNLIEDTQS
jgi:hypothetical protein